MFFPGCSFSSATALATSPCRVEFRHSSGSLRVVEATYFGRPFSDAAKGTSSDGWARTLP